MSNVNTTTVVIAGLGGRGRITYAAFSKIHPELMRIVAIADLNETRLNLTKQEYNIPKENCFLSAEEMFSKNKMADMAFICTQDADHVKHAAMAIEQGYDVLLEKPISADIAACNYLLKLADEKKRCVTVCHVLRYTPYFRKIKELIDNGVLGRIISIQASENVGYWHMAHSFVRGNWRRSDMTSPMILAKCCHDMDVLVWLTGSRCEYISSYGGTEYFNSKNAPEGSSKYCLQGCKVRKTCPFDAEKIYMHNELTGYGTNGAGWMQTVITPIPTEENLMKALYDGQYGRCVFHCDNNVVDHQVISAKMENQITIDFSMCGFNDLNHRMIHIMGTKADLIGDVDADEMTLYVFGEKPQTIKLQVNEKMGGHNGGDYVMLREMFDKRLMGESVTSLSVSLESHYMAMAAEESRLHDGIRINVREFAKSFVAALE